MAIPKAVAATATNPEKLYLEFCLCPGDTLIGTAAVECLHQQYPGRYMTDVKGTATDAIFAHNPHITRHGEGQWIVMQYPLINQSGSRPVHFIQGYVEYLAEVLGIKLECSVNRPYLYLSEQEKGWVNQVQEITGKKTPFWIVCSGIKKDYTIKGWSRKNYQSVVDALVGEVQFVQVGESGHNHPPLDNVIDLRGKTDTRQLIRLAYHAAGGLGGVSFLHHIFAAFQKPFVTLASGQESVAWERYNSGLFLHRGACLPCGNKGNGCWKSRTVKLNDGDEKDRNLCELPIFLGDEAVPKCLAMIRPEEVVAAIRGYQS